MLGSSAETMPTVSTLRSAREVAEGGQEYPNCVADHVATRTRVRFGPDVPPDTAPNSALGAVSLFGAFDTDQAISASDAEIIEVRAQGAARVAVVEVDDHVAARVVRGQLGTQGGVRQLHAHARGGVTP